MSRKKDSAAPTLFPPAIDHRDVGIAPAEVVRELVDQGRLIVGGPFPAVSAADPGPAGFTGSLIIAEFDSLEAATAWADSDPYVDAGVFSKVTVKPYKKVLP